MKKILHSIGSVIAAFVRSCPRIALQGSSYPDRERKCFARRYLENLILRFRDGMVCEKYNALGLDICGRSIFDTFVEGQRERLIMRELESAAIDYTALLANKYLFYEYLSAHGIPVVPVLGHVVNRKCYIGQRAVSVSDFLHFLSELKDPFFFKIVDGWCGHQILKVSVQNGVFYEKKNPLDLEHVIISGRDWIVQPAVQNVQALAALNPSTLNTIRIATAIMPSGEIQLWDPGLIRIGRKGSDVDNHNAGGVFVAIESDGKLAGRAGSKLPSGVYEWMTHHPDTGLSFCDVAVPYYDEMCKLVCQAHELFPTIRTIGWDVAITEEGPMLLEGNHDWDVEFMQTARGVGQMKRYMEIYC